jgi:hypothetical protein
MTPKISMGIKNVEFHADCKFFEMGFKRFSGKNYKFFGFCTFFLGILPVTFFGTSFAPISMNLESA